MPTSDFPSASLLVCALVFSAHNDRARKYNTYNDAAINWYEVAFTVIGVNIIAIGMFWWLRKCYFRKEDSELLVLDEAV